MKNDALLPSGTRVVELSLSSDETVVDDSADDRDETRSTTMISNAAMANGDCLEDCFTIVYFSKKKNQNSIFKKKNKKQIYNCY